ncbi:MAG: helicase-related protein [Syntrophaceae bacterium]|nr:helicase-related protein [Syntrophaceae bacterium]
MKLEDIKVDAVIEGIVPNNPVTVEKVTFLGADTVSILYRTAKGNVQEQMLFRDDESALSLVEKGRPWSFDADGASFRLGAEANRIRMAYLFDPLMAVHTSNVDPLPHQITAVYESMLPKQPLRFLLADDPGAGKTIMAGLLIRELMVRGDLKRCLIIAPGSLVEQWQDELDDKFGVSFRIFSWELDQSAKSGNPFDENNMLICRLDQLSRNDDLQGKLTNSEWDLVIVDEAHKMAAHFFGGELKTTKRYKLGELVGSKTRHLLLMTATPHNGKEEDFQLFLALLDSDRFYGKFRDGVHKVDTSDLMRRMIKEDLLKFDGTKLFPERKAYTVNYELSDAEAELYEKVTNYVREEMNRADNIEDGKRRGTIGFALTILQRRLASSPAAIYSSLNRRRIKLEQHRDEEKLMERGKFYGHQKKDSQFLSQEELDDIDDEASSAEIEELEEQLVETTSAATNLKELEAEIEILKDLEEHARQISLSGNDRKWDELSKLLQDNPQMIDANGSRRKIIIFTEHRDTLNYLVARIQKLLGKDDAVLRIDGSVKREERRRVQERFTQDKEISVLIATDAAGEGVNLQRANLMVNYDLPWNPNRLEQRFGRIHRIGQTEVCHLWNVVAHETREGQVYQRLLEKLDMEREALGGRVFDILGEVFKERSLKELLIEAIRYGDSPDVRKKLYEQVDMFLDREHLKKILQDNALASDTMDTTRIFAVKEELEKAEARKLQPHFIKSFFDEAFGRLGGTLKPRESGRYEITHVPFAIRDRDRVIGVGAPVMQRYERVCFEKDKIRFPGKPQIASFVSPGHPLMNAVLDLTLQNTRHLLRQGAILIDEHDFGVEPRVMYIIEHSIKEPGQEGQDHQRIISQRMQFALVGRDGSVSHGGYAPYLDYKPATAEQVNLVKHIVTEPWLSDNLEAKAIELAASTLVPEHFQEVKVRRHSSVEKTLQAVHQRLTSEIIYWSHRAVMLREDVKTGKQPRIQPERAERTVAELKNRLEARKVELENKRHISSNTPVTLGAALIIPRGLIDGLVSGEVIDELGQKRNDEIERMAMDAVMKAELARGHIPKDVSKEKIGWDITSHIGNGEMLFIEVKGRQKDATTVTVSRNEVLTGLNKPENFILAIVKVDEQHVEGPYYVQHVFSQNLDFSVTSVNCDLNKLLDSAKLMAQS